MTTTATTFKTRSIHQRHELDKLAPGAYILDFYNTVATVTDEGWFYLEALDIEVNRHALAFPIEVLDEGALAFEVGDTVRVVVDTWNHSKYRGAPVRDAIGTVSGWNGNYFEVDFEDNPRFPLSAGEIELVEPEPLNLNEFSHSFTFELNTLPQELLDLIYGRFPAQRSSVEDDDDGPIVMLLTTEEELSLLDDGSVIRAGRITYVKEDNSWLCPGEKGTYNIAVAYSAVAFGGVDLLYAA